MSAKPGTVAHMPLTPVDLSCGCTQQYRNSPPSNGDTVTCITHGAAIAIRKKIVDKRRRQV